MKEAKKQHNISPAMRYAWGQFTRWDRTAGEKKKTLSKWKYRVLILTISAAFFGIMAEVVDDELITQLSNELHLKYYKGFYDVISPDIIESLPRTFIILSALCVTLASFAGAEILTSDLEKSFVKSRSIAEAIKAEAFLFAVQAQPYEGDNRNQALYNRVDKLSSSADDIASCIISTDEEIIGAIPDDFTIQDYVEQRIRDQVYNYYQLKGEYYRKVLKRGRALSIMSGVAGVIIGTISAAQENSGSMHLWIAFISAGSSSIASYLHSSKYELMMMSYQVTCNKLKLILSKFKYVDPNDIQRQKQLVLDCEAILALENSAWLSDQEDESNEESTIAPFDPEELKERLAGLSSGVSEVIPDISAAESIADINSSIQESDISNTIQDQLESVNKPVKKIKKTLPKSLPPRPRKPIVGQPNIG